MDIEEDKLWRNFAVDYMDMFDKMPDRDNIIDYHYFIFFTYGVLYNERHHALKQARH